MTSIYKGFGARASVPQTEQATSDEIVNHTGGYVFQVDDFTRLRRFLILGTEGGTYYQGERKITKECYDTVVRCLTSNGERTVKEIVDAAGNAPKMPPILFALAVALGYDSNIKSGPAKETRRAAAYAVPIVCKIPTHLWMLLNYLKDHRGHGVLVRKAVQSWLREYDSDKLAYHMIKYRGREGWTWRDLLREFKPKPRTEEESRLYAWAAGKLEYLDDDFKGKMGEQVTGFEVLQRTKAPDIAAAMISDVKLPREAVPTELLNEPTVWAALLLDMPYTAMVRNLGKMGSLKLLHPFTATASTVVERILDPARIKKSHVHPIQLLSASLVYGQGQGVRGSLSWEVNPGIVQALEKAFYIAFDNVQGTGKNLVIGLDVSSSMTYGLIAGIPGLTPVVGEAAMSLLHAKVETVPLYLAFTKTVSPVTMHGDMSLDGAIRACQDRQFGGTDCSAPMNYCIDNNIADVDAFIVYTDSETWAGRRNHPAQALGEYRRKFGKPDAKLIVVGFTATDISIADPQDGGMLDVVGFDTSAPELMSRFIRGEV